MPLFENAKKDEISRSAEKSRRKVKFNDMEHLDEDSHPLDLVMRHRFLKKMADGEKKEEEDEAEISHDDLDDEQTEFDESPLSNEESESDDDESHRADFARRFMTSRAVRRQ